MLEEMRGGCEGERGGEGEFASPFTRGGGGEVMEGVGRGGGVVVIAGADVGECGGGDCEEGRV